MNNNRTRAQSYQSFLLEEAKRDFSVLLFYYMKREHLEYFLETGNVKVTQLSKSNDPLEFLLNIEEPHKYSDLIRNTEHNEPLVVCLSSRISSSTMWGHYAESHKGVCLVFSLPIYKNLDDEKLGIHCYKINRSGQTNDSDDSIIRVEYVDNRSYTTCIKDKSDLAKVINKAIATKASDWKYESEVRLRIREESPYLLCDKGLFFYSGLKQFFKGVVLGYKCEVADAYVRTLISASSFTDAFVARAEIQKDQYLMQPWLSDDIYICDTDITSL